MALAAGLGCVCGQNVPTNDRCTTPSSDGVETLELGAGGDDGPFRPLADGDLVPVVFGSQGGRMLTVRLRAGPKAAPCVPLQLTVRAPWSPTPVAEETSPLNTYSEPGGTRVTRTIYVVAFNGFPSRVELTATVGSATLRRSLRVDTTVTCGQVFDCEQYCTSDCASCAQGASPQAIAARDALKACVDRECNPGGDAGTDAGRADAGADGGSCAGRALNGPCLSAWDRCSFTQ